MVSGPSVPTIVGVSPKQVSAAPAGTAETNKAPSRTTAAPAPPMLARIVVCFMAIPFRAGDADIVKGGVEGVKVRVGGATPRPPWTLITDASCPAAS